ncbi:cupin domain-containing protein [Streptomyces sp. NRRL WC-3742]|uniref:cupin domain-containing protein n=1 Tax=Streptomyces sp. NRRL WC-3742 TaxID=1463934 RepID=UPI000B188CD9|nr:cupin domain-containing protein [Streptomyces sp. NRRL WC-3742]
MDRFILLAAGTSRPTTAQLPPGTAVKASVDDTEGRFGLTEHWGLGPLLSPHQPAGDEILYLLDGELKVETEDLVHHLTPGMCVFLPRGTARTVDVQSEGQVRALRLSIPAPVHDADPDADADGRRPVHVLARGEVRPGRIPVPPAFAAKVRGTDTGGRLSLLEMTVAQQIPRHVHHLADEAVYVLTGDLAVEFAGQRHLLSPGQFVLLPHGIPHALAPGSTPPPRVLQVSSPGGWECFVEDFVEARTSVSTAGRLDPRELNRIAAPYAITYEDPS